MNWAVASLAGASFLAMSQLSFKWMSHHFSPQVGTVLYLLLSTLLVLPLAGKLWMDGQRIEVTWMSAAAVGAVALTSLLFVAFYQKAFQLSPSTALVVVVVDVGAALLTTLVSIVLLNEPLSLMKAGGIVGGVVMAILG